MSLLPFLITAFVLSITPGPGIAYVVACTIAGGRSQGLASCIGTGIGGGLHVVAAALGLSYLVAQSALAFNLVKYAGAAYLVYLGLRLLLRTRHEFAPERGSAKSMSRAMLEGILVEALNVKTALFFLAFLPQFVSPSEPVASQLAVLGSICVVLNTMVDVFAVLAAQRLLESSPARTARARMLTKVSGCTMLGLGAFLAFAKRQA